MDDSDIPALGNQVKAVIEQANRNGEIAGQTFTMRIAKERVAEALGIDAEVFSEPKWKKMVKTLIQDALENVEASGSEAEASPPPKKAAPKPKPKPVEKKPSRDSAKPKKGKERVIESDEEVSDVKVSRDEVDEGVKSESDMSVVHDPSPRQKRRAKRKSGEGLDSDEGGSGTLKKQKSKKARKASTGGGGSGSSDVEVDSDDSAPPKKAKAKNAKASGSGAQVPAFSDRVQELKGIVTACGIRKQWAKELADMSDKQQISHLKSILSDLGMTGEPNKAKAKRIKEKRALEAELEDVKAFAEVRGATEPAATGRPRRSAAVPKQSYKIPTTVDSDSEGEDKADSDASHQRKRRNRSRSAGTTGDEDDDEGEVEESEEEQEYEATPVKAKKGKKAKRGSDQSESEADSD